MEWSNLFIKDTPPSWADIDAYINHALWRELNAYLQNAYNAQPKLTYSCCPAQKGWNIKYQKSGKSLCTLYPLPGFFIALVVIGNKEQGEAESLLPRCSQYTQELYRKTTFSCGGRWLMLHVMDQAVLRDAVNLIQLRVKPPSI
jgi:hypothetical protein